MKTLYLIRHSTPQTGLTCAGREIPLSAEGKARAAALAERIRGEREIDLVFSSPLRRALETAQCFSRRLIVDDRLAERDLGGPAPFTRELWAGQYSDPDLKNGTGESFCQVRARMESAIGEILKNMHPGQTAAVVSHAAAICAYLQGDCCITVVDARQKLRSIVYKDKTVLCGAVDTPSCFRLEFSGEQELRGIVYWQ